LAEADHDRTEGQGGDIGLHKPFLISALILILGFSSFPSLIPFVQSQNEATAAVISSSTTSIGPCASQLCSSPSPQNFTFDPSTVANYFGQDLGAFSTVTSLTGFTWLTSKVDNMTIRLPTVGGSPQSTTSVFYNSTHTVYQLSGLYGSLSVFFKPSQYRVKISVHASLMSSQTVCLPLVSTNPIVQEQFTNQTTHVTTFYPSARAGNEVFDWRDIPSGLTPSFSSSSICMSLPLGITNIDPIALDSSGSCTGGTTCVVTIAPANAGDLIIVIGNGGTQANSHNLCSVTDALSDTYTARVTGGTCGNNGTPFLSEFSATDSSSGSLAITCHFDSVNGANTCIAFGISGASGFDSHSGIPATATGNSGTASVLISTSNANDMILGLGEINCATSGTASPGTGFTTILQQNADCGAGSYAEYDVVSSTQTNLNVQFTLGHSDPWGIIADAVKASAATVTQPIKIITANSAPSATITISGCGASNGTFTANGNVKHYASITASCTITLTRPTPGVTSQYAWNVSPHPTIGNAITFTTCAGPGTCSEYDNTTYFQLFNAYKATPTNPTTWDGAYTSTLTGTFLGVGSQNVCQLGTGSSVQGGGQFTVCSLNSGNAADYGQPVTIGSPIGNTWFVSPAASNVFTSTTGGNTLNANYLQGAKGTQLLALLVFAGILVGFIMIALIAAKRR
jgi:hypothetical protein